MKFEPNYLVFDLETGGLKADKCAITEIAVIVVNSELETVEEYSSMVLPYGDYQIQEQALKATGMTLELIEKEGRDSASVCDELVALFKKHKNGRQLPILVGHNIDSFDIPFLDEFFTYHKKDLSKFVETKITVDTLWWGRMRWTESANYKLTTCCDNAGVELVEAHRAMSDTRATKDLFVSNMKNLRGLGVSESGEKEVRYRETFEF